MPCKSVYSCMYCILCIEMTLLFRLKGNCNNNLNVTWLIFASRVCLSHFIVLKQNRKANEDSFIHSPVTTKDKMTVNNITIPFSGNRYFVYCQSSLFMNKISVIR